MADVGDGGRFHFHGDRLREIMADLRQTDRAVNEGIPLTMRPRTALRSNALMQLCGGHQFSSALKPAGQPELAVFIAEGGDVGVVVARFIGDDDIADLQRRRRRRQNRY